MVVKSHSQIYVPSLPSIPEDRITSFTDEQHKAFIPEKRSGRICLAGILSQKPRQNYAGQRKSPYLFSPRASNSSNLPMASAIESGNPGAQQKCSKFVLSPRKRRPRQNTVTGHLVEPSRS